MKARRDGKSFILTLVVLALCSLGLAGQAPGSDCEKARELLQEGVDITQGAPDCGEECLRQKEYFYRKAIELCPDYAGAYNNLGEVNERQGRYREAIAKYQQAIKLNPNDPRFPHPYFGLGDVYFKLGRYEPAAVNYEKGLKLDPEDGMAQKNLTIAKALSAKILFPFNSDRLTDAASGHLKVMVTALSSSKLTDTIFEIQGHTDSIGSRKYNLILSKRRAERVKKYLIEEGGIAEDRLIVKGYGEDRPIVHNNTKEGRKMNRMVQVISHFSDAK